MSILFEPFIKVFSRIAVPLERPGARRDRGFSTALHEALSTRNVSAITLRDEKRSAGSSDETRHLSARRKVKSRFGSPRESFHRRSWPRSSGPTQVSGRSRTCAWIAPRHATPSRDEHYEEVCGMH